MSYAWTVAATLIVFGLLAAGDRETREGGGVAVLLGLLLTFILFLLWMGKTYL